MEKESYFIEEHYLLKEVCGIPAGTIASIDTIAWGSIAFNYKGRKFSISKEVPDFASIVGTRRIDGYRFVFFLPAIGMRRRRSKSRNIKIS